METEPAAKIAQLNDEFRRSGQGFIVTPGIRALSDMVGLVQAIQTFDSFTPDNDPYGEHDFGSIDWHSEKTFWKIDYYDQALKYGLDPLDPDCKRV